MEHLMFLCILLKDKILPLSKVIAFADNISGVALGAARAAIAAPIFSRKRLSSYNENVRILTFRLRTCNLNGAAKSADICIGFKGVLSLCVN